jgi:hypothetical protein
MTAARPFVVIINNTMSERGCVTQTRLPLGVIATPNEIWPTGIVVHYCVGRELDVDRDAAGVLVYRSFPFLLLSVLILASTLIVAAAKKPRVRLYL